MRYIVTVTTPEQTTTQEAWNYFAMVTARFKALMALHDKGWGGDQIAADLNQYTLSRGEEIATIITTKGA